MPGKKNRRTRLKITEPDKRVGNERVRAKLIKKSGSKAEKSMMQCRLQLSRNSKLLLDHEEKGRLSKI